MIIILLLSLLINLLVFVFNFNSTLLLVIFASLISGYRGIKAKEFSDIFNIKKIKTIPSKWNVVELITSIFITIIVFSYDFTFQIYDICLFLIFTFIVYRFILYNTHNLITDQN